MLVSRKYLALIHFVAREVATGLYVAEAAHKSIECSALPRTGGVLLEPLPKRRIQGFALGLGHAPGLFDEGFFCAQSDVLHTRTVYTMSVCTASVTVRTVGFAR